MTRNRKTYLGLILITIILGLLSRTTLTPEFIYPYLGDYLYALMYFFITGFLFPNKKTLYITLISIGICYLTELSQLSDAEWISNIRNNKIGGLIIGISFLWSDIISYTFGGITGFILEKIYYSKTELPESIQ